VPGMPDWAAIPACRV